MEDVKPKIQELEIVVIDPNEDIRNLLKLQFNKYGFPHIKEFSSGEASLEYLMDAKKRNNLPALVMLDTMLSGIDGLTLCQRISSSYGIPVIILSARLEAKDEIRGLEAGASDYVRKPYNFQVLLLKAERLLTQQYFQGELTDSNSRSQKLFLNILQVMAKTLEAKDPYSSFHSQNVSTYARELARALGFASKDVSLIGIAGMLHDIGKIGIKETILLKEGPLTSEEYERIKKHPFIAAVILEPVEELSSIIDTVRYHHEKYDGTGYPTGLKGENIPLGARIMAIADSYDAMTTERPYRHTPLTQDEAIEQLKVGSAKQFDPKLIVIFINQVLIKKGLIKNPHMQQTQ
jgi:putative two-component system response regulator